MTLPRIHAFELEDQAWFPVVIRDAGMAYLRFAAERTGTVESFLPFVRSALEESGEQQILDLCSGGGGPVVGIAHALHEQGCKVSVTLTDLFPSPSAAARLGSAEDGLIRYESESVDATAIPAERPGLRTLFNAFHHFRPEVARRVLASAVAARRPIAVVEMLTRRPIALLAVLFIPLAVLLVVPFLRPFRPAWILFTYLIPVIPLYIFWDGLVSTLRIYDRDELLALARSADPDGRFAWRVEEIPIAKAPIPGIGLFGRPTDDPPAR